MNLAVIGVGYVGLVTGVCLAEVGHNVTCFDMDERKIELLKKGISPIHEDGLEDLMKKNYHSITYTSDPEIAYRSSNIIFICVGTPEKEDGSPNLDYVFSAGKEIAKAAERDCLVVVKSTVPIGTNSDLEKYMNDQNNHGSKITVASNPEFLAQGTAVKDTLYANRIVIGSNDDDSRRLLEDIYKPFDAPIVSTDRESAEMIKYASNDFLALKISFVNDIANLCEIVGANIEDVTLGMSYDERIGNKFLNPGIGYGGSCFPKDTKALHWLSEINGYQLETIKAAIDVNERQKTRLINKARSKFTSFKGVNVAVLGLTFKPNTDDLREAPSLKNIAILLGEQANIKAYDPEGIENCKKIYQTEIDYKDCIEDTLRDADVCFIFTEWKEIREIDIKLFKNLMKSPVVYDGRNCFNTEDMSQQFIEYHSIGR